MRMKACPEGTASYNSLLRTETDDYLRARLKEVGGDELILSCGALLSVVLRTLRAPRDAHPLQLYHAPGLGTFVREDALTADGKIDFEKIRPILFEMQQRRYLRTGGVADSCWNLGRNYKK